MTDIIEVYNLKKSYKDVVAVNDISFNVKSGSLFAFLGVNGAGKSTTINILCTLLKKDDGKVMINGNDLDKDSLKIKNDIGIVFQNGVLDNLLTVKENLTVRASYYGLRGAQWSSRLQKLTEILSLEEILKRPYGKLSGGQKRRVDIARGIIHEPKILFLDEPTTGLDPQTRQNIWRVIEDLRTKNNTTIFLTTHYMEEADNAHEVVILDSGKIIAQDTPIRLKSKFSGEYIKIYGIRSRKTEEIIAKYDYLYENDYYKINVKNSDDAVRFITSHKELLTNFEVIKGNMDDVFLNATGKSLKEVTYEKN